MNSLNQSLVSKLISFSKGLGILMVFSHHFARSVWSSKGMHEPLLQQWQFNTQSNKFAPLVNAITKGELFDAFMLFFAYFGYIGVHLFIVASGIGLALGYRKNEAWAKFMARRLSKIVPPFWFALFVFATLWWLMGSGHSLGVIIRKMFLISTFYEKEFLAIDSPLWFISLIFQLYIVFPFLYRLANRFGLGLLPFLIVLSYCTRYILSLPALVSWHSYFAHGNFINWLPVFYTAILFGSQLRIRQQVTFKQSKVLLVGFLSLVLSIISLRVQVIYPITDTALAILIVVISFYLYQISEKLNKTMILVGNVSFCIYLYHRPVVDKLLILLNKKNLNDDVILLFVYIALFVGMVIFFKFISSFNHPIFKATFPRG
jgi:peptidoglycan/LPS O-acetylase OafA/YrhL